MYQQFNKKNNLRECKVSLQFFKMAKQQLTIAAAQMHAVALAVAEPSAGGAFAALHPGAVAVRVEAVLPHFNEIICINIALAVVCTDAATGGD